MRKRHLLPVFFSMCLLAGCQFGADSSAKARALTDVRNAAAKLMTQSTLYMVIAGPTYTATAHFEFQPAINGDMQFDGNNYGGELKSIDVVNGASSASVPPTVATRIPTSQPWAIRTLAQGAISADEFGGVEVKGVGARRYDAVISWQHLKDLATPDTLALYQQNNADSPSTITLQVDIDNAGNILRIQYSANRSIKILQTTDEGGALNAVSVDFSPTKIELPGKGT